MPLLQQCKCSSGANRHAKAIRMMQLKWCDPHGRWEIRTEVHCRDAGEAFRRQHGAIYDVEVACADLQAATTLWSRLCRSGCAVPEHETHDICL